MLENEQMNEAFNRLIILCRCAGHFAVYVSLKLKRKASLIY